VQQSLRCELDVSYGSSEREKYDIITSDLTPSGMTLAVNRHWQPHLGELHSLPRTVIWCLRERYVASPVWRLFGFSVVSCFLFLVIILPTL